jgi:hypothetical protein
MKGNETSGKAIIARQREGDTGTFAFIDNLARAKRQAGRVLVDLIPKIYDSPRMVRITGLDGDTEFVPVNHELSGLNPPAAEVEEQWPGYKGPMAVNAVTKILNDITVGKYDATVTVGPSYATQRQESADGMINFVRAVPQIGPMIAHVIAKNMDWPGSDEIAGILKKLLPPQLLEEDKGGAAGAGVVPGAPGGAVEPPPAPDPRLELMAAQMALKERELALKEVKTLTEAMASIAKAESMEAGTQIQIYKALVDQLLKQAQGGGAGTGGPGGPGIPGGPGGPGAPGRPEAQAQGMPSGLPGPGVPVSPGPGGPELPDYGIDRALPPELGGMPAY